MTELTGQDVEASEADIEQALEMWWIYLETKLQKRPDLVEGISHSVIDEDQNPESKTVNLSLVDKIAPELSGLGQLTPATSPHVYVEGIRSKDKHVGFDEVRLGEWSSLPAQDAFRQFLESHRIAPSSFLLSVYSADDFDHWNDRDSMTVVDIFFVKDVQGKLHAMRLKGLANPEVRATTTAEMSLIRSSFENAAKSLEGNN